MKESNKSTKRLVIVLAAFFMVMITLTVIAMPYINRLSEPNTQEQFKSWVISLGVG